MNAASMPLPDPVRHDEARKKALPLGQPLPARRVTHLASIVRGRSDRIRANPDQARLCVHWPKDGAAHIEAGARAVRVMAGLWAHGARAAAAPIARSGCIDLETLACASAADAPLPHLPSLAGQIQTQKLALRGLADDYATISAWLARAAGSSWDAAKAARQSLGLALVLGEGQRLITKDWLAADINALIAAMLRRSANLLDRLELTTSAIEADLAGPCAFGRQLSRVAELLDCATSLARNAAVFVGEFDQRWQAIRHQVADAVALTADPATAREPRP